MTFNDFYQRLHQPSLTSTLQEKSDILYVLLNLARFNSGYLLNLETILFTVYHRKMNEHN